MRATSANLRTWLYGRHLEALTFQTAIEQLEALLGEAGYPQARRTPYPTIVFFDLGGYTHMTQEAGGEAAVQLAARLIGLVRRAAADNGGCVQLSPGRCRGGRRLAPGAAGLLAGGVVSRDGDYFGQTSEPASRIADYARPWEVLVSADVAEPAKEAASYEPTGDITLRGVIDPASLFRAQIRDTLPAG
jgi:adenylate cyclase